MLVGKANQKLVKLLTLVDSLAKWPGHQAFFPFFFFRKPKLKENGVQTAKSIVEGEVWRQDFEMQTLAYPGSQIQRLGCEATECRLCKHCGCMLSTDYIWLCKSSSSEKIDPHMDQKQEIKFVWPKIVKVRSDQRLRCTGNDHSKETEDQV